MPRPDMPTMDLTHAMTFAPKIRGIRVTDKSRNVLARYRALLRRAEKFTIDDDAVRLACRLSHQFDKLPSFAFLARLPFDVTWIEYNLQAKVVEFNTMNTLTLPDLSEVPERSGVLLYKDDPDSQSPRWVATQFLQHDGDLVPAPLSFVFDPEGGDYDPVRGSKFWRIPTLSSLPGFPKLPVTAPAQPGAPVFLSEADAECLLFASDLHLLSDGSLGNSGCSNQLAVLADPFWTAHFTHLSRERFYHVLKVEVREEMGQLRWLMTLLAAINNLPKEIKPIQHRAGKRSIGANILPYFQHRTIKITLPKDDRVSWAVKNFESALRNAPRPWHRVSGHWRVIERGKTHGRICRHLPTMVEQGLGMCEKCELMIRWIPEHHRGTPDVGIVEHTYAVGTR